jgi:hypothetical protein
MSLLESKVTLIEPIYHEFGAALLGRSLGGGLAAAPFIVSIEVEFTDEALSMRDRCSCLDALELYHLPLIAPPLSPCTFIELHHIWLGHFS